MTGLIKQHCHIFKQNTETVASAKIAMKECDNLTCYM